MKLIFFLCSLTVLISCNSEKQTPIAPVTKDYKPKKTIKTVGIFLYEGYTALDAMGPYQVFRNLMGTQVFFVAKEKGIVTSVNGVKTYVDSSIADVKQLDVLVIPGGLSATYELTKDQALLSWIKQIDQKSTYTTSVCTGAWVLGACGFLKEKEATTHWYGKEILNKEFGAKIVDKRYTHSDKYWTSAGVTAGMDMSLALVNDIMGKDYTEAVMLDLEYDPAPPVKGGSVSTSDTATVNMMRKMYDAAMTKTLPDLAKLNYAIKKDPVCMMPLTAGIKDTAVYKGKIYGFCAKGCKDAFAADAAKYAVK